MDRPSLSLRLLLAAPTFAAAAFVISIYIDRGQVLEALPRPVLVAAAIALLLQLAGTLVFRSAQGGAYASLVLLVALIDPRLSLLMVAAWVVLQQLANRKGRVIKWHAVGTIITVMFAVTVIRLVGSPAFAVGDLAYRPGPLRAAEGPAGPDIFLILLDGYPRSDTLASYGYDNGWFEQELEARGFRVAPKSHTNYEFTYLVLPTMFQMAHALEIDAMNPPPDGWAAQRRAIRGAMESSPALETMREAGYRTISTGWPASVLTLTEVDEYIDSGGINQFEREVLQSTSIDGWFPDVVLSHYRDRVLGAFSATETVASDPASTFMFTHILSPHVPFVFDRDGELPSLSCGSACDRFIIYAELSGMTRAEFQDAYADQVHYLNGQVLDTLDHIVESSPNAAVVLFSDHGARADHEVDEEWYATFFASRTPGRGELFTNDARPIEVMPRLMSEYFGKVISIPSDSTYYSPYRSTRPLTIDHWMGQTP